MNANTIFIFRYKKKRRRFHGLGPWRLYIPTLHIKKVKGFIFKVKIQDVLRHDDSFSKHSSMSVQIRSERAQCRGSGVLQLDIEFAGTCFYLCCYSESLAF